MSIFVIKIIACVFMVLDHIKYAIPSTINFFTIYSGRIAFPLFAFMIVQGYCHTKNLKKYLTRMIIFALISQIPFMLFRTLVGDYKMLNIMFTFILGLIAVIVQDKLPNKIFATLLSLFIIWLGDFVKVDYGWFGVALVWCFFTFRKKKIVQILTFSILVTIFYYTKGYFNLFGIFNGIKINTGLIYYFFTLIPILCMCLYNGKLGRRVKYIFYWFYPAHMLVLYFCNMLIK